MKSTNEEINKFLTEQMGDCWHELEPELGRVYFMKATGGSRCVKCDAYWNHNSHTSRYNSQYNRNEVYPEKVNLDFFTWEGFGKLWEWAQKQEWWSQFKYVCKAKPYKFCFMNEQTFMWDELIHPEQFATAVYEALKEREK